MLCKLEQAQAQAKQNFLDETDPEMFHWRLAIVERASQRLVMWHTYHHDPGPVLCLVSANCSSGGLHICSHLGTSWEAPDSAQPYYISKLQDINVHYGRVSAGALAIPMCLHSCHAGLHHPPLSNQGELLLSALASHARNPCPAYNVVSHLSKACYLSHHSCCFDAESHLLLTHLWLMQKYFR